MGSGKSTVGRLLAERLARPFVDLDQLIEEDAGEPIGALFQHGGEARFRGLERVALERCLSRDDAPVIAVGGGALCDAALREEAHEQGTVVLLHANLEALVLRLSGDASRPLLSGGDARARLMDLAAVRGEAYEDGPIRIDTSDLSPAEVVARIAAAVSDTHVAVSRGNPRSWLNLTSDPWRAVANTVARCRPASVLLITDDNVARLYLDAAVAALADRPLSVVTVPNGEPSKRFARLETIVHELGERGADRDSLIVSLGGGVVSDLAGFAAAIYMRGIRWVAVPTTTLAMVDAAIGGKTGVDVGAVKNLAGVFHLPVTIVSSVFTSTEGERGVRSGLAEAIKTLAVGDAAGFEDLERDGAETWLDEAVRTRWIAASAQVKARLVRDDFLDHGGRVALNFGHTFGHALESLGEFSRWTHGEAVALGMVAALRLGVRIGVTPASVAGSVERLIVAARLPHELDAPTLMRALPLLRGDKKRRGESIRFVCLPALGQHVVEEIALSDLGEIAASLAD
jgi:shikimate kinase/3-dehydroquinate synthase